MYRSQTYWLPHLYVADIQICNVKPLGEGRVWREAVGPVPERIARFYRSNDVSRFQLDRPVHKGPIDKENEFKSLWLERTVLTTAQSLPGILRFVSPTGSVNKQSFFLSLDHRVSTLRGETRLQLRFRNWRLLVYR